MAPAHDPRDALAALEARAIRDKEQLTYNATLGSVCGFLVVALGLTLPSPWRVLNGEWSSSLLVSLAGLAAHGVLVLSVIVAFRCAHVQASDLWEQFTTKYLGASSSGKPSTADAPVDRMAALNDVVNLKSLHASKPSSLSPVHKTTAVASETQRRSFFDPPPVATVEEGKAYVRRLQQASREKEASEDSFQHASGFGGGAGAGYPTDGFGIYGAGAMLPRVYQASGFDPSLRDTTEEKEEDALTTSSNPQVAWAQLEDVGLAMFMHLYVRNIRRLLACHVKDFVEAFVQNSLELNECGVMADVLLRRVPVQALLCPPAGSQLPQMTNVSLAELVASLKKHPAFVSKTRGVYLFAEHMTFEKYLNVGEATTAAFSSLERQEYVLERLIMLSKDRNLDRFRWDQGAPTYKGKPWTEALPSDIDILMNVFCCIMDNMLPADHEKDRPFTKSYFMGKAPRRPFTPAMRSRLYFVKTVQRPPHFKILAKAVVREIVPCEENCFHAIVVYLHALKKQKAGHLESINMHRIIDQVFDISK